MQWARIQPLGDEMRRGGGFLPNPIDRRKISRIAHYFTAWTNSIS
jgi:hypothetical protein